MVVFFFLFFYCSEFSFRNYNYVNQKIVLEKPNNAKNHSQLFSFFFSLISKDQQ